MNQELRQFLILLVTVLLIGTLTVYLNLTRVFLPPEYFVTAPKRQAGIEGPLFTGYRDEGYLYDYQPGPPVPPEIPSDHFQIAMDADVGPYTPF